MSGRFTLLAGALAFPFHQGGQRAATRERGVRPDGRHVLTGRLLR